ncbi:vanadium-dependent haloperoxidase [Psychroflexus planctonicus]|uniref:PAP2 superfamily protein n=1 Tax=Psychroflexus planctonicus TaxID=1526575 RepID=A0ABQ1SDZ5_9FLAO|nr:vanadium-dependent haloperoxidase [Psychroflexus planctonicus]GGE30981.1 hypothetical protein GCM10010832_09270 [Psychroflexus planctonicus]
MKINFSISIFLFLSLLACQENKQSIKIEREHYHHAIDKLTEVMVHDIFSPPVASRIYVYPNIAAYQTFSDKSEKYFPLTNQLNGLQNYEAIPVQAQLNLNLASLIAYINVSSELVFSKEIITNYRDSLYLEWKKINPVEFEVSKKHGIQVAEQIINWMQMDGYVETRNMPDYNIFSEDPSVWQPTPPAYMKGIEPHWNKLRPFVLDSASQFKPVPPPEFSLEPGSKFYKELISVYNINNTIRGAGDESEEIAIARFWDCNPFVSVNKGHFMFADKKISPGAHWVGICKIACNETEADFKKSVYAQTKTSIAIADAFISCWDEKYRSNLVRPETLITKYIDSEWLPILQTPPFPEYTSGHSVVSNSAAEVLTDMFGENFGFLDTTEIPYGLPSRKFNSFKDAANEAARSRVYGGIHYDSAVFEGITQGSNIGKLVNEKIDFLNTNAKP